MDIDAHRVCRTENLDSRISGEMMTIAEITKLLGFSGWRIEGPHGEYRGRVDRVFDPLPNATNLVFGIEFVSAGRDAAIYVLVRTVNEALLTKRHIDELRAAIQGRLRENSGANLELDFIPQSTPGRHDLEIAEAASTYPVGENHPLASTFGVFANEPLWDDLIGAMNEYRREVAEQELRDESAR